MRDVPDARLKGMIDYPLYEILVIAFLAVLAGASGWTDMMMFGKKKKKWLKKFLPLQNGIPSHDTFRTVFSLIDPVTLEQSTVCFILERLAKIKKALNLSAEGKRHICVDGKEERGTGRKYGTDEKTKNLQTLHIHDASNEVCLFSVSIPEKTNEIPVAQELLKSMNLKGCIVTFDAMNTQKDTVEIIAENGGDYVGALKGSQKIFHKEIIDFFTEEECREIRKKKKCYYTTIEKAHNKVETRSCYLTTDINWFEDKNFWMNLKSFIRYDLKTEDLVTGEITFDTRFYISSSKDVELCATSIRGHWSVEVLHWHLDVNFNQDDNTTMNKNAITNLSILNKLCLSLYKIVQPLSKWSIRGIRKGFAWDLEESLTELLNAFDEKYLKQILQSAKK